MCFCFTFTVTVELHTYWRGDKSLSSMGNKEAKPGATTYHRHHHHRHHRHHCCKILCCETVTNHCYCDFLVQRYSSGKIFTKIPWVFETYKPNCGICAVAGSFKKSSDLFTGVDDLQKLTSEIAGNFFMMITDSMVVLTCCKGDCQSQRESPIFGPTP